MKHIRKLAAAGRGGDNTIGHLTTGEIVVPKSMQTARLMQALMGEAEATGVDLGRYTVGGKDDSRNPKTGAREFMDADGQGTSEGAATGAGTGGYDSVGGGYGDVGYGGKDEGTRAMEAAAAAAPGAGPFGGSVPGDYAESAYAAQHQARSLPQRAFDWAIAQPREFVQNVRENPISTFANIAAPGAFGLVNAGVGLATGKSLTDHAIAGIANMTGFNSPAAPSAPSGTQVAGSVEGKTTSAIGAPDDGIETPGGGDFQNTASDKPWGPSRWGGFAPSKRTAWVYTVESEQRTNDLRRVELDL